MPQTDPADLVQEDVHLQAGPAQEEPPAKEVVVAPILEAEPDVSSDTGAIPETVSIPSAPAIDKSVAPEPFSTYAFKERKRQLKMESAATDNDIWEIIEAALEDYFSPRNAKKRQRKQ
ncbi:hypothetical protein [Streptomyces pseudovenezuelae]|uniref:hypothetical protein n=1 Tax=Streptomyces pseudovenezuelae TaxID=67350 RepID=UPI0036EE9FF7